MPVAQWPYVYYFTCTLCALQTQECASTFREYIHKHKHSRYVTSTMIYVHESFHPPLPAHNPAQNLSCADSAYIVQAASVFSSSFSLSAAAPPLSWQKNAGRSGRDSSPQSDISLLVVLKIGSCSITYQSDSVAIKY